MFVRTIAFWVLALFVNSAVASNLRTVALSHDALDGLEEDTLYGFSAPLLNNHGDVAFLAETYNWSDEVVVLAQNGALTAVAYEGSMPSGTEIEFGEGFSNLLLNNRADVAFTSFLNIGPGGVTASNNDVLWLFREGNLLQVAREGFTPAGLDDHFVHRPQTTGSSVFRHVHLNNAGELAYTGNIRDTEDTAASIRGLWRGQPTDIEFVGASGGAFAGSVFPGTTVPFLASEIWFNDLGRLAVMNSVPGDGFLVMEKKHDAGAFSSVIRAGTKTPDGTVGLIIHWDTGFNDAGHLPYSYTLFPPPEGPGGAVDVAGYDATGEVVRELYRLYEYGDVIPGTHFKFATNLIGGEVNSSGHNAWTTIVDGVDGGRAVLLSDVSGETRIVAMEGDRAPGTGGDMVFDSGFEAGELSMNAAGQVAIQFRLSSETEPLNDRNDEGIWAQDVMGTLQLVVREGDVIDVDDGPGEDMRQITELGFNGRSGGQDGRSDGFNDLGEIAFYARFSDGTSGVFLSSAVAQPVDLSGDYDFDGDVDSFDYETWRETFGSTTDLRADGNENDIVDAADYVVWRNHVDTASGSGSSSAMPSVPEPNALALLLLLTFTAILRRPRR